VTAIARYQESSGVVTPVLIHRPSLADRLIGDLGRPVVPTDGLAARLAAELDPTRMPIGINDGLNWLRKYRRENWPHILRGLRKIAINEAFALPGSYGTLGAKLIRGDGDELDYGIVSTRMVTTAGAGYVIDAWQALVTLGNMKYHGIGTTNTAEGVGDTALAAEVTTGLNPASTRATGTTAEGASSNIFRSVGTNTVGATLTIVEHMLFSQAATGGGVGFDRSIFAGIGMLATDQLQTTYDWTLATGG
jgi:hypothetical protein